MCTQTAFFVDVIDVTDPDTPTLDDVTAECLVEVYTPTTTDNCAGTINGTTSTTFPITTQGTTVVTWNQGVRSFLQSSPYKCRNHREVTHS